MDEAQVAELRGQLDRFVGDVFASLKRRDQRDKGGLYLRGLMIEGRRKSMQPMGDRLGIDYQQLQQFVSTSPRKVEPVRRQIAKKAVQAIEPQAWVVDDTGSPKPVRPLRGWPGSIRGLWARSATSRSASASTGSPMLPLAR